MHYTIRTNKQVQKIFPPQIVWKKVKYLGINVIRSIKFTLKTTKHYWEKLKKI